MIVRRALSLASFVVLATLATSTARAGEREAWFDFKFQGHKVGYLFAEDEATNINDKPALHAKRWSVVIVRRQEQVIRMESTTDAWSEPDGKPMRFKHIRLEGRETRNAEGYRDGNVFIVRQEVGGNTSEKKLPLDANVFLASSIDALFFKDMTVGKSMSGKVIVEEEGELRDFTIKVTGTSKTDQGQAFVVEETVGGVVSKSLVLAGGKTLKVEVPMLGAEFSLTTKEKALKEEAPVDIFSAALFSVQTPLPSGDGIDELVVRLAGKSGKPPKRVDEPRQRAKLVAKNAVELSIRSDVPPKKTLRLPLAVPSAVKPFLKETPYETLADERLVATVQRVVGDEKNAWEAARKINAFVHAHITRKTLARAFATATEALETREGDCTEHAVLFSALAKIAGIPTRLVTGLVYVGGKDNVFGYHEWVEVWMDGRWIAMDPTFGQDLADPTHIKFTHGQSDPDGLRDAGIAAASLIGDLELSIVEYTTARGEKRKL